MIEMLRPANLARKPCNVVQVREVEYISLQTRSVQMAGMSETKQCKKRQGLGSREQITILLKLFLSTHTSDEQAEDKLVSSSQRFELAPKNH